MSIAGRAWQHTRSPFQTLVNPFTARVALSNAKAGISEVNYLRPVQFVILASLVLVAVIAALVAYG